MDSLEGKRVYPLNVNDWIVSLPSRELAPLNLFSTSNKEYLNWFCPCCGGWITDDNVDRLLVIMPPENRR
eukprot:8051636-Prorocentrum_lima.AAC.1